MLAGNSSYDKVCKKANNICIGRLGETDSLSVTGVEYDVDMGFQYESNLFEICHQKVDNLAGNSSPNKVGAKSDIRRVSETGRGGSNSMDWVGRGKSTKIVEPVEKGE